MMGLTKWYHLRSACTTSFHVLEQLIWTMGEKPKTLRRHFRQRERGRERRVGMETRCVFTAKAFKNKKQQKDKIHKLDWQINLQGSKFNSGLWPADHLWIINLREVAAGGKGGGWGGGGDSCSTLMLESETRKRQSGKSLFVQQRMIHSFSVGQHKRKRADVFQRI